VWVDGVGEMNSKRLENHKKRQEVADEKKSFEY